MSTDHPPRKGSRRLRRAALLAASALLAAALLLTLSWYHVLPGGWRLRNLLEDPAVRRARDIAARRARLAEFAAEKVPDGRPLAVFFGSSTIELCPLGVHFPKIVALNRGIGGESAREMLERVEASIPEDGVRAVVLYAGRVDLVQEGRPVPEVVRRVRDLARAVKARAPGASLALLGILPDRETSPEEAAAFRAANDALRAMAAEEAVAFVETWRAPVVTAEDRLSPAHSVDTWHLSFDGYHHLARWLDEDFFSKISEWVRR